MRCAIYARYSSDMQRPESIDDQIRQCRKHIESKGWSLVDECIYTDYAVSGSDDKRTAYLAMKEAGRAKLWDCVVVDDLSRLGRHTIECLSTFDELTSIGVNIIGVADGIDTAARNSKLPFYIKSMMNEIFLDDLREKVKRGQAGQIGRGYNVGGRLFGYRYTNVLDPSGALDDRGNPKRIGVKIEIDPEQEKVVQKIFEMKARGYGLKTIAHYLNDNRYMRPRGNGRNPSPLGWSTGSVRSILRHTKYIGDWSWGKKKWVKQPGTGKKIPIPQPESEWAKSHRPDLRIIKQSVWDKVQEELNKANGVLRKSKGHFNGSVTNQGRAKYLFSGLLKCGKCGGSMIVTNSGSYSAYMCNNCCNRGKSICDNNRRILRETVERDLLAGIQKRVLEPKKLGRLVEIVNGKIADYLKSQPSRNQEIKVRIGRLEKEIDNLSQFVLSGDFSPKVREMLVERETKLAASREELATNPKQTTELIPAIDPAWVSRRIGDLRQLFARHKDKMDIVREELKSFLGGKIRLIPLPAGGKWAYEAEATIKPGNVLAGYPFQYSVIALRGIEPRSDG